jgi:sulfhydrogenase subunit beta (sulfur reductase)
LSKWGERHKVRVGRHSLAFAFMPELPVKEVTAPRFLPRDRLPSLLNSLRQAGYRCVGPQLKEGAIVYDALQSVDDLPLGVHDRQTPGEYRLHQDQNPRYFAWANGPQALKPLLFAPRESLWRVERDAGGHLHFRETLPVETPIAVIGARACDLAALRIQDKIFMQGDHPDPYYGMRRKGLFIVAVNCSHPAATCFCASTGDGPGATHSYDIALDELDDGFVATAGSAKAKPILHGLALEVVTAEQRRAAADQLQHAARIQTRTLPGRNLRDALFANLEHPRWDAVAERCLSCGNCTSVCPTCFCHAENEQPQLNGESSEHVREWDSCFTQGHSYIHGLTLRADTRTRYRQWLTHKLGSWHDQFDSSGCVGCGRCISWCPVGIDITEETRAICGGGE